MKLKKTTGNKWANNADAVMGWYRQFRTERKFPNPSKGKAALPPFLGEAVKAAPWAAGDLRHGDVIVMFT